MARMGKLQLVIFILILLAGYSKSVSNHLLAGFGSDVDELKRVRRSTCIEGDCKNGGFCWPTANVFCACPDAYTGKYCTIRINYCATTGPANCQNGATCSNTDASPWFSCSCAPGFTGSRCETNIDDCASRPCANGRCTDLVNSYSCSCYSGWEGANCNINTNDCFAGACLNGGRCLDGNGTYTCDCSGTGFNGTRCEINIDDCASKPCLNGLCTDLVKNYSCSCFTGWEGRNCSVDTDYCLSGPCRNGGVCSDGNWTFSCDCSRTDFQGPNCSSRINDCESAPCHNGGRCIDGDRSFSCDCSATDFDGPTCLRRIDDCSPNPCSNNASCSDGLRNFSCSCFAGYSGKSCSEDTADCTPDTCKYGGVCLERSNQTLYGRPGLPAPFNGTFSYAQAAGFVCACPNGSYGDTCEINPNDCLVPGTNRSVCAHASACTDGLASFTCHCLPGYEGPTCSVDINECELFGQPCQNGAKCEDLEADYACSGCPAAFGGKNCSVRLTGCDSSPCQNNATCRPTLEQELPSQIHSYRCTCRPGWWGPQCNLTTLASLSGASRFSASWGSDSAGSSGDWIFELSFRTSLAQFDLLRLSSLWGLVRVGAHNSSLVLLFFNASASVIGRVAWPISDSLASTDWLTLSVSLTNGSATLTRSESGGSLSRAQTVDGLSDSFRPGRVSVDVGGDRGSAIDGRGGFRGCVRDLRLVTNGSTFVATETSVESGNATWGVCSRSEQCASPSPCEAKTSSMCVDVWNDFVCECLAGFGGRSCSVELPSFSLGVGGNASSASFASVPGVSSVYGGDSWTIELRLVTLSRGAFLLLLGDPSDSATTPRLLVTIDLDGHLFAQLLHSNSSQIASLTSSDSVATGSFVPVRISVTISGRKLTLAVASAVRSASLSSASPLSPLSGRLIIGGFSGAPAAPAPTPVARSSSVGKSRRSAMRASVESALPANSTAFRGVISAARVNERTPLILGPVSPAVTDGLPGALSASDSVAVSEGVINENVCKTSEPCQNGATCTNFFYNLFSCKCTVGWRGATCSVIHHCVLGSEDCPNATQCVNLEPRGYECRAAATFQASPSAKLNLSVIGLSEALTNISGWVRTRELNFSLLSVSTRDGRHLSIIGYNGRLQASLDNQILVSNFSIATGTGFTFTINCSKDSPLTLSVSSDTTEITKSEEPIQKSLIIEPDATVALAGDGFRGCLNEIRLNGYLTPLTNRTLPNGTAGFAWSTHSAHASWAVIQPSIGCQGERVCHTEASDGTLMNVCQNSGQCEDLWNKFECKCIAGFSGPTCSIPDPVFPGAMVAGIIIAIVVVIGGAVAFALLAKYTNVFRPSKSSDLYAPGESGSGPSVRVGHLRPKSAKPVDQEVFF